MADVDLVWARLALELNGSGGSSMVVPRVVVGVPGDDRVSVDGDVSHLVVTLSPEFADQLSDDELFELCAAVSAVDAAARDVHAGTGVLAVLARLVAGLGRLPEDSPVRAALMEAFGAPTVPLQVAPVRDVPGVPVVASVDVPVPSADAVEAVRRAFISTRARDAAAGREAGSARGHEGGGR